MPTQPIPTALTARPQPGRRARREFLRTATALAAGLGLGVGPGMLAPAMASAASADSWTATWGTAPAGPPVAGSALAFSNQTLRLIAHASIGGSRVRVRLSNEMGSTPLQLGSAWIGVSASGANLVAGSNRQLRFAGRAGATIAAGAPLLSDPVDLVVPLEANLAVSLYLPGNVQATTVHDAAFQTSYASSAGDYAAAATLPVSRSLYSWPFLTEIDVTPAVPGAALVAIGDSQTDGARSSGSANKRWTDCLARRLLAETLPCACPVGVVNRGISGNRLLGDADNTPLSGKDALERFDRDVLGTAGVRYLAVLLGINDIVNVSSSSLPTFHEDIIAGYVQLIARAHTRGVQAFGATLLPFEGFTWYSVARDAARQRVNDWIRTAGAFDAVLDFDAALRDPDQPLRLLAAYDGGDHLHPNDLGFEALAAAVPLSIFTAD
jgi:lysophospholipase L1-like esterase